MVHLCPLRGTAAVAADAYVIMEGEATTVAALVASLKERKWVETLRPVDSFVQPANFRRPRNGRCSSSPAAPRASAYPLLHRPPPVAEMTNRVELNLLHFASNYVLITLFIFTVAVLSKPALVFVFGLVAALWWFVLRTDEVRVGQVVLKEQRKMMAAGALTSALLFLFAGTTLFMIIGFSVTLTLAHAALHRTPDIVDDENVASMEMQTAAPSAPLGGGATAEGQSQQ